MELIMRNRRRLVSRSLESQTDARRHHMPEDALRRFQYV